MAFEMGLMGKINALHCMWFTCTFSILFCYHDVFISTFHYIFLLCLLQVNLSVSHDGYLHFGDTVCIYNPATETTLSANMSESKMHDENRLVGPCDVSASKMTDPCIRNTFVIG